jgi:hypothetical protein
MTQALKALSKHTVALQMMRGLVACAIVALAHAFVTQVSVRGVGKATRYASPRKLQMAKDEPLLLRAARGEVSNG